MATLRAFPETSVFSVPSVAKKIFVLSSRRSRDCRDDWLPLPTAIDLIRVAAVRFGLVRIREHRRYISVQFMAEAERVEAVLVAVAKALTGLRIHEDTFLVVDNLLLGESRSITLGGLQVEMGL